MALDEGFFPALWALASSVGTRPETLLAVWAAESGLLTTAKNPQGCIGLNQSCPTSLGGPGFPNDDPDAYQAASASAQLEWIGPQVVRAAKLNGGPFLSAARYMQANFLPATLPKATRPNDVIAARTGPYAAQYSVNKVLDVTSDGAITLVDLGRYLQLHGAGAVLDEAIAQTYAARPSDSPWDAPRLAYFEPTPPSSGGRGGLVVAFLLGLGLLARRRAH